MGILDKIGKVIQGKANDVSDKIESDNIEVVLRQSIRDDKKSLVEVNKAVTTSVKYKNKAEREVAEAKREVEHFEKNAKKLLEAGANDDIVKKALVAKNEAETTLEKHMEILEKRVKQSDKAKQKLKMLKVKIEENERKVEELISSATIAKETKKVNENLSSININDRSSQLSTLEEKVNNIMDEAAASEEMLAEEEDSTKSDIEKELEKINKNKNNKSVDDELAALKAEMNKSE